ncbi:MAG: GGDEF domain-containing protein [Pseudomonadota bacterium]
MKPASQGVIHPGLQSLLLKRFAMAVGTYALALVIFWMALLADFFRASPVTVLLSSVLVLASQLVFLVMFRTGCNLRFRDPSLTEPQILIGLTWLTVLLGFLEQARGTFLMLYVLVLLFGVFQLPPRRFARCAAFAFFGFAGLHLWEASRQYLANPGLALLQTFALLFVLIWLSLFASYVQSLRQRMQQRRFALQAHQDTLRGMMHQLEELAATDELTGLFNRRHFLRLAARELASLRPGHQHGLALIDLDHFKRVNDQHGHACGDRVLQSFATVGRACLREGDVLARYGGEEFVLLLLDTDEVQFAQCCERLRLAFAGAEPVGDKVEGISLSAGMTLLIQDDDLDEALQRADQALYRAKRQGRNRCAAAWEADSA